MPARRSVERTRSLISRAAASVKVITSTCSSPSRKGAPPSPEPGESAQATRCVSVKVLPEPAPASTKSGSSRVSAIFRWRSFRQERSIDGVRSFSLTSRASSRS